jgi:hypothetical protein
MKKIVMLCTCLWSVPAFASDDDDEAKAGGEKPQGGKFSLLSRDCKAEEEGLETTPGSPPLDVDDPGTPGCNGWEVNLVTNGEFGKSMSMETPLLDMNYGIGDNLQLKAEIPYEVSREDGESSSGFGSGELGIKYRFYDNEDAGLAIAIYPQLEFAIPGTAAADGDDGTGTLTKLPLLVTRRLGETSKGEIMLTANLGYNHSTRTGLEHYVSASLGVGFPLISTVAMMVEASTEQAFSKDMEGSRAGVIKANVGVMGGINEHLKWFGAVGESFASADSEDSLHTCVVLGIRLLAGGP